MWSVLLDWQTPSNGTVRSKSSHQQLATHFRDTADSTSSHSNIYKNLSVSLAGITMAPNACSHCNKPNTTTKPLKPCNNCKAVAYCNRTCQLLPT